MNPRILFALLAMSLGDKPIKLEPTKPAPMKHREHVANLRRAYWRTEQRMAEMRADAIARGVCPCCVGASYGGTLGRYDQLERKQRRREELLNVWGWQ